jgi:flavodoxin
MESRTLITYYSWSGNTESVAKEIQALTGYDSIAIVEKKERKKSNMPLSALTALLGLRSRLMPMDFNLDGYDRILLGCQVWAWHSTPAVNSFISRANFKGKKVFLFITKADDMVPQKVIDSITSKIRSKGGEVADSLSITTTMERMIEPDEFREELSSWLKSNGLI